MICGCLLEKGEQSKEMKRLCFSICCQNLQETALKVNHRWLWNVPRPLPPEFTTSPVGCQVVVLCPVPEPGGRGRWQVSRAGPPFPRQPPGQLRFGEERGSRPLRLGWRHPPESWRNIYHVSNQISLIQPRVSQCTKALCCNRAWDIRGRGRDVSKTDRAVRGLLKELLLAWVFLIVCLVLGCV